MDRQWYENLARAAMAGEILDNQVYETLLTGSEVELLQLLAAAFQVRQHFHGLDVTIHILNNVRNGLCSEDCSYCAQSKSSLARIIEYPEKSDTEILAEARLAYEAGAHRYCMVYAGRGISRTRVEKISSLVRLIKKQYPIEVCVSAGQVDEEGAQVLKEAGLDRLNHNLNTSERHYAEICTTHSFADRVQTLRAARKAGLEVCAGIIAGMGESAADLIDLARQLREVEARSIPVNFLMPIKGIALGQPINLNPQYCLRILCLFRFINPAAEIRTAAGRELHLRGLEAMSLYPANSLFMDGYLNTRGSSRLRTLQMIRDAGFTIRSDKSLDELLAREQGQGGAEPADETLAMKSEKDLRPTR